MPAGDNKTEALGEEVAVTAAVAAAVLEAADRWGEGDCRLRERPRRVLDSSARRALISGRVGLR